MTDFAALRSVATHLVSLYALDDCRLRFYAEEDHFLFLVYTAQTKYILKLRQIAEDGLQDDTLLFAWLRHLQPFQGEAKSLDFCRPIPNQKGDDFSCFAGYVGVLYPWIPGRKLQASLSLLNAQKWGRLMAVLHKRSSAFDGQVGRLRSWRQVYYWEPCVMEQSIYQSLFSERRQHTFRQMELRVNQCLQRLYRDKGARIIHGDLHPANVKVYQGHLCALDFDDFMWGYPIQDIAIALLYVRHRSHFDAVFEQFKKGYTQILPWPDVSRQTLSLLWMGRLLWMANARLFSENLQDAEAYADLEAALSRYESEFLACLEALG